MKKLLLSIGVALLTATAIAQTNQPPPASTNLFGEPVSKVISFLSNTATNWLVAGYGIYSEDTASGGAGIAGAYTINDFVATALRLDYIDGEVWMPSGNLQLQLPLQLANKVTVIPFIFTGLATPLGGRGEDNGSSTVIYGSGLAGRISKNFGLIYDAEKWERFDGVQHRFGVYWKF